MGEKTSIAVIGAGFGDEGKGLITNFISPSNSIVCRFNGGAQAGHTVTVGVGEGKMSHVFSHVGSNAPSHGITYLSSNFIANPFVLNMERGELGPKFRINPTVFVSASARVTTIFDIVVNRAQELMRGDARHGSCGLGINETVTRCENGFPLQICDLTSTSLEKKISDIYEGWYLPRFAALGVPEDVQTRLSKLLKLAHPQTELTNLQYLVKVFTGIVPLGEVLDTGTDEVIFEGAQGLMLDEELGQFPHVTRSVTGLKGAVLAAREMDVTRIKPLYVSRVFSTRHGAGLLKHEGEFISDADLTDTTNVKGEWQGEFRYAPLDVSELKSFIEADLHRTHDVARACGIRVDRPSLALTHLDKIKDRIHIYDQCGVSKMVTGTELIGELKTFINVELVSLGPTSHDVGYVW